MNNDDKPSFSKALRAYYQTVSATGFVDATVMTHYWEALKPYPLKKVMAAIDHLARNESSHAPPARMVEQITGVKKQTSQQEFDKVLHLIKRHGVSGISEHLDKESKAFKALKAIGGARAINENPQSARIQFVAEWDRN